MNATAIAILLAALLAGTAVAEDLKSVAVKYMVVGVEIRPGKDVICTYKSTVGDKRVRVRTPLDDTRGGDVCPHTITRMEERS